MFNTLFYQPILQSLIFLNNLLGDLGLAIIVITVIIRLVMVPLTMPAMRAAVKMRDLKPKIDELKKKYKDDKMGLQQAQMELFRNNQVNPAAGCLPYIVQFIVLIALYRVFMTSLNGGSGDFGSTMFLWFDLKDPDPYFLLPLLTGLSQLVLSLMILPGADASAEKALAASTKTKKDDKQAEDLSDMATTIQQQMVLVMPVMMVFLAARFPSGLALYWVITTVFSIVQQYYISGWGGLTSRLSKFYARLPI